MRRSPFLIPLAWLFAAATTLLLVYSLRGVGDGIAGSGVLTQMGWSYLIIVFGAVLLDAAFWPERKEDEPGPA